MVVVEDCKMGLMKVIIRDKEIQELKKEFFLKYGKNAPPYCIDADYGLDDYKEKLRRLIDPRID